MGGTPTCVSFFSLDLGVSGWVGMAWNGGRRLCFIVTLYHGKAVVNDEDTRDDLAWLIARHYNNGNQKVSDD